MAIDKRDFEAITEADIQELVEAQVAEGLRLDFKRETYGGRDADKRELLKDVSAFGNTQGGHLLIGIEEEGGTASAITGIEIDIDAEILRIEQILRNAIDPPISNIRIKGVTLGNGKSVLVIRVPKSWNPPHKVSYQGSNKFYLRHSAGVHEPSIEELRMLFTQSKSGLESAQQFRNKRISDVSSGQGTKPLYGNGRFFLHIVPLAGASGLINLEVEDIHNTHHHFSPIATMGMNYRFNYHGYITEVGGDNYTGYTQIFRDGSIEATLANLCREREGKKGMPGVWFEKEFFKCFPSYIRGLEILEVPPPLYVMLSFEGLVGAEYAVLRNEWDDERQLIEDSPLFLPTCIIDDYSPDIVDYHRAIRPAFNAIWNAAGYSKSLFYNDEGEWVGEIKK